VQVDAATLSRMQCGNAQTFNYKPAVSASRPRQMGGTRNHPSKGCVSAPMTAVERNNNGLQGDSNAQPATSNGARRSAKP
jgi:hypothetical protein